MLIAMLAPIFANAQDCDIDISIANITKGEVVPQAVNQRLEAKLSTALARLGIVAADYDAQFFIVGRFDDAYNDITSGSSQKVAVKTTLTLSIGDAINQKVFATESFDLKGVGSTDEQAYTKALNSISSSNQNLLNFIQQGKERIIEYYDANYSVFLTKARNAMAARNYDEALYYSTSIPSCCVGYKEACNLTSQIYTDNMNYIAQNLLAQARAAWAESPDAEGARKAYIYLSQIDPSSSSYSAAQSLGKEISQRTKQQWDFENVQKYNDAVALEKQRIEAAKQVAVAWAKSRPKVVNRYTFISRRW
jgi:hypothetical protein